MRIHPAGKDVVNWVITILGAIALIVIMFVPFQLFWVIYGILLVLTVLGLWTVSFFRYPKRKIPKADPKSIFSVADGKVVVVEKIKTDRFPEGEAIQISVFMSIYSVHLNYVPVTGTITSVEHRNGLHLMAIKPKASLENEQAETIILTESGHQILVRQIAGAAARRVLTFVEKDQKVKAGDELGFIRFGSRVDHIIPVNSIVKVKPGDKVTGCKSVLAELNN
ncbi:Phosphatidylserine decarboxylase proenzyme [bioreactor metagenome]|uniref:Phosphatidylserine decarboxylase proenzyme n=1 Tax=bioreactor metagenome TaxID=1076179 RepID=A0A644X5A5_9ZZZZ